MKRDVYFSVDAEARARQLALYAVAFSTVALVAVYWRTAESIVSIWIRSETFAHGFMVVPLSVWLAWRRRDALALTPIRPWWPGTGVAFLAGAVWMIASSAGVGVVMQFALVVMVQAAIVTIIGLQAARVISFALAFLFFAPPAGEFLVPTLMDWTADFTIAALRLSGIPVYREGNHFVIPTGNWSVIEACSGIRYIIASLMVGTLYAAIAYQSTKRRIAFLLASLGIPLVANWLRAYMIVMLGHLSNNKLATGIDHILYGWIFFGLVMFLLFWVGSRWRENSPSASGHPIALARVGPVRPLSRNGIVSAAFAALVAAGVWLPVAADLNDRVAVPDPRLPSIAGIGGWVPASGPTTDWKPHYKGYRDQTTATYASDGRKVDLYLAYYRRQGKGNELVTSGNVFVSPLDDVWRQTRSGTATIHWNGRPTVAAAAEVVGRPGRIEVLRLYWIAGRVTADPYVAKMYQALAKITGQGDDAALIVVYARASSDSDGTRDSVRAFMNEMSPAIARALATTRDADR